MRFLITWREYYLLLKWIKKGIWSSKCTWVRYRDLGHVGMARDAERDMKALINLQAKLTGAVNEPE